MERLDAFMARANAAYYAAQDPFADFTTAPEISQAFGEILGLWAAVTWAAMGRPEPVRLAEAGPGRGTLMADALRAVRRAAPDFAAAATVHFIETSARLRAEQARAVPAACWHGRLEEMPAGPLLLLANEFLDALPVRQFERVAGGWAERYVQDGRFVAVATASGPAGAAVEIGEAAADWVAALARRLAAQGGAALILDYGPAEPVAGYSLQALRGGRPADPLAEPGAADLTAHVDFAAMAAAARRAGAAVHGPVPQGVFLARLGLFRRTDRLARGQAPARAAALVAAAQRLAEPSAMGGLFKVLALTHAALPVPEGFSG